MNASGPRLRTKGNAAPSSPAHELAPVLRGPAGGTADVGVVIARHERHVLRVPSVSSQLRRAREFGIERDVHEIAGHRDVVRRLRLHVGHDRVEHVGVVMAVALAVPVDDAEPALVDQLAQARRRDRAEVRVGQVGEHEHRPSLAEFDAQENNGARTGRRQRRHRRGGTPRRAKPCMSAMGHRRERGRHIGVAQVNARAPGKAALAAGEIDNEGQHGSHQAGQRQQELLCTAQIVRGALRQAEPARVSHAPAARR